MKFIEKIVNIFKKWNVILDGKHKRHCILIFIIIFISSLLETIGISIILPFVSAIIAPSKLYEIHFINKFVNNFSLSNNQLIIILGVLIIAIYIVKNLFLLLSDYICLLFENELQKDFSLLIYSSYIYKSYEDVSNTNSAEVIRGIGNDVSSLYYIMQSIFKISSGALTIILISILLLFTSIKLSLVIVLLSFIVILFNFFVLKSRMSACGKSYNDSMFNANKTALQGLNGLKEIIILNRQDNFISYYKKHVEDLRKEQVKYRFYQAIPLRVIESIFVFGIVLFAIYNILVGVTADIFIPELSLFAVSAMRAIPIVISISNNSTNVLYYYPSFNNAYNSIIKSRAYLKDISSKSKSDSVIRLHNNISLSNVNWKYKNAEKFTLMDVNLTINKGDVVGIIGASGSGKSTLVDIIIGLLHVTQGSVIVDGNSIMDSLSSWTNNIGYVPQNVYLLDDTIRNNITFGESNDRIDDDKIWKSLEQVNLKSFVENLPDKLDTLVGERGSRLSGGQSQRIDIARVLYNNPEVIVLDEATSALDNDTEKEIIDTIYELSHDKTVIIISHRLSSLKYCNKIFRVKNNKVEILDYMNLNSVLSEDKK